MKKLSVSLLIIGMFYMVACNKTDKKVETKTKETAVSTTEIKNMKDSAEIAWNHMMANDDAKFKNMLALLDNISYIPGADDKAIKNCKAEVEALWKSRYDKTKMRAAIVDGFDQETSNLINKINTIAEMTKSVEKYANVTNLQQEIRDADANTLMLDRAHYDNWAKKYNTLITKGNPKDSSSMLPLFETLN